MSIILENVFNKTMLRKFNSNAQSVSSLTVFSNEIIDTGHGFTYLSEN